MELIDIPPFVYPESNQKIYLHNFTDLHMGAVGCDRLQLRKDIKRLREARERGEQHYWFLGGDAINAIGPKDKRHDAMAVSSEFKEYEGDDLFRQQVLAVEALFEPIREWGLFVGAGNHESTVSAHGEYNPARDLAHRLNLPYAGYSAGFRIVLAPQNTTGRSTVTCYWHHGFGASRTKGGKINMGMALLSIINVDLYFTGHVHEPIIAPEEELSLPRKKALKLIARDKLIVVGASYLKTYPITGKAQKGGSFHINHRVQYDYGERKGYRPAVIGHVGATLRMKRGQSENSVEIRAADFR